MAQKKDRSRFTIKFRENDPAHDMTIRILEKQGQRNIAPFLVNAVLHYVQCTETPDVSHMLVENSQHLLDRNAIADIVWGILRQQRNANGEAKGQFKTEDYRGEKVVRDKEKDTESINPQIMINDDLRAMINRSLSVFRCET